MPRPFSLLVVLFAAALFVGLAQANPLAQIKEAANTTRDAAEDKSEEVAAMAEEKDDHHHDHADHAKTDGHAKHDDHDDDYDHEVEVYHAVAVMIPTEGNTAQGVITFDETDDGVTVTAIISGLNPNQKHGFHIHEFGDISAPDGTATGGHYNPEGHDHILPNGTPGNPHAGHAGDLGNLQADADGNATYTKTFDNITIFDDDENPIIGRGVIIHANEDDGGQPTGNAGPRIAQGVVGVANTK
ncbi:MAG: superoxide dismutase family protein [Planctomycetota bacterium]